MAFSIPPYRKRIVTVIRDADGRPVMVFESSKSRIVHADKSVEEIQETESRPQVDGRLTHPGRMSGPDAELSVLCELCPRPPRSFNPFKKRQIRSGLAEHGINCSRCGRCVCLLHARQGRDGSWRCIPCARVTRLWNWLVGWLQEDVE